ncbi:mhkC, partial [Symbiodinium sp. KB8]
MHRRECEMDVIHQTFAKHYAELFNQEVHRRSLDSAPGRCGAHDVDFLLTHVVELPEKSTYSAEAFMLGEYRKHNTNGGFTMGPRQTPQSFSYFTFIKSGKRLMIVDIQGVGDLYTDPVIHFLPSKVSGALAGTDDALNFALRGFDQLLGLPVFGLSPHE